MGGLSDLDPEQQEAVLAPRGPVCVLAGAGTGKTRTITRRIAHLVSAGHVAPGQVLAVTFTSRAAGEMRTRLRALGVGGVQARTFHAATLRQLRYFWPQVVGDEVWPLLDQKLRAVGQAANQAGAPTVRETLRDMASEIEWAKSTLVSPQDYPAAVTRSRRDPPVPVEQMVAVYEGYEDLKARNRLLDFEDLLLHTAAALEENSTVAEEFRDRYRCFVVDEYQDVTPAQQRVLDAWLGARDDLTVVGDVNQTIYSFAGAAPTYLLGFSKRFPDAVTVRLERDYRSTPQVVTLANRLVSGRGGRGAGLRLIGQQPSGPEPEFGEYDDEPSEAAAVADRIAALIAEGVAPAEIAVLYRVNAQSEGYEQALDERGIPFQVRGGERFFQRAEVRAAMRALRQAAEESLAGSSTSADAAPEDADPPVERDLMTTVRAILEPVGLTKKPPTGSAALARWESLQALVDLAVDLAETVPDATLQHVVAELAARADASHPPTVQGVTLATLHAAKGLEWDAVFLVGLVEGTVPIQHAGDDEAAIEEERRLLYVGVTRARFRLSLTWALARSAGGRKGRRRSRFLYGLIPDDHPAARMPIHGKPKNVARCRICGSVLTGTVSVKLSRCAACPSDADPDLLDRLRDWRTATAKTAKVPAYVVFTDATLTAIAEQRPGDVPALVSIPGIGAAKLERYGEDVLALVRGEPVAVGDAG